MAGTNRADILDDALTRPGRFDRRIRVDKPDSEGRNEIFLVHLKGLAIDGNAPADIARRLAGLTPGFSGADISNLCNEATIVAARRKADAVRMDDFERATDRIVGGLEARNGGGGSIASGAERRLTAYREAGRAVASWFLEGADPPLRLSVVPRGGGGGGGAAVPGYSRYPSDDAPRPRTYRQILDAMMASLAGRAAEDVFFDGQITTGSYDDLRRVTENAYGLVRTYGMSGMNGGTNSSSSSSSSSSSLGQLSYAASSISSDDDPHRHGAERRTNRRLYSEATAEAMDVEVRRIVDDAYGRTCDLLSEKTGEVEEVARLLLRKETMTRDDLEIVLGRRPPFGH
uniref:AAA+ ATPase domain-containing protein n=1 Tax=Odontella aurita TaxID=265563 RepID=A0A7S4ISS4_9STRA